MGIFFMAQLLYTSILEALPLVSIFGFFLGFVKMNGTYVTAFESLGLDR
jgi:hypothetical protein